MTIFDHSAAAREAASRFGVAWPPANGWHSFKTPTNVNGQADAVLFLTNSEIVFGTSRIPLKGARAQATSDTLTIDGEDAHLVITMRRKDNPGGIAKRINFVAGEQTEARGAAAKPADAKPVGAKPGAFNTNAAAKAVADRFGVAWPPANGWHSFKMPTNVSGQVTVLFLTDSEIVFGTSRIPLKGAHAQATSDTLTIDGEDAHLVITMRRKDNPGGIAKRINFVAGEQAEARGAAAKPADAKPVGAKPGVVHMFEKRKARKLAEEQRRDAIRELRTMAASLPDSEGNVAPEQFGKVLDFAASHDLALVDLPDVRDPLLLGMAQRGCFLEQESTLLLKKDETALWDEPATLLKEVAEREFRGGSQGLSIPVGTVHGRSVRYRVGAYRGHMVTIGTHWVAADSGTLTITNQRVVYHGGRKTLEFAFNKLATLNLYSDAIDLGVTTRQSTSSFGVTDPELIAGLIHAALNHANDTVTIVCIRDRGQEPREELPPPAAPPPAKSAASPRLEATIELDPPGPLAELRITPPRPSEPLVFRWRDDDFIGGEDAHMLCHGFDIGDHRDPQAIPGCLLFQLAGGTHHLEQMRKHSFGAGQTVLLVPEPDNPHDANAIAVWNPDRTETVGYVPRNLSSQLGEAINGKPHHGLIVLEWKRSHQRVGLTILVGRSIRQSDEPVNAAVTGRVAPLTEPPPETVIPDLAPSSEGEPTDPVDQIRRLGELRDQGLLTEQEFEAKKAELLRRI